MKHQASMSPSSAPEKETQLTTAGASVKAGDFQDVAKQKRLNHARGVGIPWFTGLNSTTVFDRDGDELVARGRHLHAPPSRPTKQVFGGARRFRSINSRTAG